MIEKSIMSWNEIVKLLEKEHEETGCINYFVVTLDIDYDKIYEDVADDEKECLKQIFKNQHPYCVSVRFHDDWTVDENKVIIIADSFCDTWDEAEEYVEYLNNYIHQYSLVGITSFLHLIRQQEQDALVEKNLKVETDIVNWEQYVADNGESDFTDIIKNIDEIRI